MIIKKLIFCSVIIFTTSYCSSSFKKEDYFSSLKYAAQFPSLNLKLTPEAKDLKKIEKSYIIKDYGAVAREAFSTNWSAKEQYLYLRALFHLEEWERLYDVISQKNIDYKDPMMGVYLLELAIRGAMQKQDEQKVKEAYSLFQKMEAKYPVDTQKANSIKDIYAAFLHDRSLGYSDGGYYFYLYVQNPSHKTYLYQALLHKYPDAVAQTSIVDFKKAVKKIHWSAYLSIAKAQNTVLYLELLKQLKLNSTLGLYYFNKGKYSLTLRYMPKNSFAYHASALISGSQQQALSSIPYAKKNLDRMMYYLATYYFNKKIFSELNELFQYHYAEKSLRMLIVLGLDKKEYKTLYKTLLLVQERYQNLMSDSDQAMAFYWLGFLSNYFGEQKQAQQYYQSASTLYPNLYYGWQSFKSIDVSDLPAVYDGWKKIYQSREAEIEEFVDKINSITLDQDNLTLQRAFFFLKIREDEKAKKYIQNYLSHLTTSKEFLYYPLAVAFYNSHRMDYFYSYMRFFLKQLQKTVGSYIFFEDLLPLLFPRKYEDFIKQAARKYKFEPSILESLILQESAYDPLALSWVGAQGLSQLMPTTGAPIVKKLFKTKVIENEDILDPRTNIFVGADYLNWLMNRVYKDYPKDDQLALSYASYNAGPKRIKKMYHRMENRVNLTHFVESIDFTESRNYVQRLTFSKDIYSFLYGANK